MSKQQLNLKLTGLHTDPNPFSETPIGALVIADNIVIDKDSVIETRRGQAKYGTALPATVSKMFTYNNTILTVAGTVLYKDNGAGSFTAYSGSYSSPDPDYKIRSTESNNNFYFTSSVGVQKLDSLTATPILAGTPQALDGNAVVTGASGFMANNSQIAYRIVYGYNDRNNNLILGAPSGRIIVVNTSGGTRNTSVTFSVPDGVTSSYIYQVYRSGGSASSSTEPNDELQLVYSANPTPAEIAAKLVTVVDVTPDSLKGAFLYTSPSQEGIANSNLIPPLAKDMALFKGSVLYANTRSKQRLTLTLLGVGSPSFGFYTDATVGTTNGAAGLTLIADTAGLRVGMRVVGTGIPTTARIREITGPNTLTMTQNATATGTVSVEFQDGLTVGTQTFWGGSTSSFVTNQFQVFTAGTSAENIASTSRELVKVVNQSTTNTTIYAYYMSGYSELPGQFMIEERVLGASAFRLSSTRGSAFNPPLPFEQTVLSNTLANPTVITSLQPHGLVTGQSVRVYNSNSTPSINGTHAVTVLSTTTFSVPVNVTTAGTAGNFVLSDLYTQTDNEERVNRIYVSKAQQPEAVPIYAYLDIGTRNEAIKRIVALRDSVFVFKGDGIFRLTGEDISSFRVTLFDSTAELLAPESAVPFNNQVFCFTDQAIAAISDNGVQIVSRTIESDLLQLASSQYTNFQTVTHAVAYEPSRQYILYTVTESSDTYATQAFVYNSFTSAWTRWTTPRTAAIVNPADSKLYSANPVNLTIYKERKSFTAGDYADDQFAITINSIAGNVLTLASASDLQIGMTIEQSGNQTLITAIAGSNVTVLSSSGVTVGAATAYLPISVQIQFRPLDAQNMGVTKQFREFTFSFRDASFEQATLRYSTNFSQSPVTGYINPTGTGGWGIFSWSEVPWGGGVGGAQAVRTLVPLQAQRGNWLNLQMNVSQAFNSFAFTGLSMVYNTVSERIK
jgi:hypothetical protein